ncbi:acetylornithine deacetylase [Candidatus Pantoea carbekii]|uniref:Acetylornithine deacetylase n=1 Tax=Candidatus Pantoea carbekii TaxID=1235990 RepID=U3U8V6_9GAMM|nr:acetylornithine deacetylase [Candidatus Pantoea carbekii]AKC32361.1 acetylornithine deacetylase [Candidatus Pantoea carbekii]BAO00083.1 ArgE protein [Candidatus Pantoea carbekii]
MKRILPPFIEIYQRLIRTPSISAIDDVFDQSNEAIINLLAGWFSDLGFTIEICEVPYTHHKFNMLAHKGKGIGGLLLAGHTDTVPYDPERWTRDPFSLIEENNRLYGLGVTDMKGFFAFILDVLCNLEITALHKPLYILATADEETTMAGAKYFSESTDLCPECAIVGEPTSLKPIRMHKGHLSKVLYIQGQSAHSSEPLQGINAIELMHKSITQLMKLRNIFFKKNYQDYRFTVPYSTMNFGHIYGGDIINRVCTSCELHIDIRPLPDLSLNHLNSLLTEVLKPINRRWPKRLTVSELYPPIPAYECNQNHKLIKIIEKLLSVKAEAVNYCTEASFIQKICPTLVLGPGSIDQAHQPDEFIETFFIKPTLLIFKKIIQYFYQKD